MYSFFTFSWQLLAILDGVMALFGVVWILFFYSGNQKKELIQMSKLWMILLLTTVLLYCTQAREYYVDSRPVNGEGTAGSPFNSINTALTVARPGDVIRVRPGIYAESIDIPRAGSEGLPIWIRADDPQRRPQVTFSGTVLTIDEPFVVVDGLILDGQFGASDVVRITNADQVVLRNCEIKNGTKDGIDLSQSDDVRIENCEIHHLLGGSLGNQVDAHGIVAVGQQNLTIRGCEIYYCSGDCFQTDPSRGEPRWDNVLIENCKLWTGPLPADAAGWKAGEIPGENAVDTKVNGAGDADYRARITIHNVEAFGFVPGYINNRAAFNIKEKVDCRMEAVLVHDNEIAFRLRGPGGNGGAHLTIINAIAYANDKIFRTEDGLEQLWIYNCTLDNESGRYFQNAGGGYDPAGFDMRNCLLLGTPPAEAADPSNLAASADFFVDAGQRDYRLRSGSPAIDAGVDILLVTHDFAGAPRPAGSYDAGAFEYGSATGINELDEGIKGFQLHPNYPNPFNPETTITFETARAGWVRVQIFDLLGRRVRTLLQQLLPAGAHAVQWDGRDDHNTPVGSGTYLYQLVTDGFVSARRMQLVR